MGRARTPASSGGKDLLPSWPSANPTDASGTFRSNPRPSAKAFIPFFQVAKLLHSLLFEALAKLVFLPEGCHSGQAERDPESRFFKQFWIPAFAGMTALKTFARTSPVTWRIFFCFGEFL